MLARRRVYPKQLSASKQKKISLLRRPLIRLTTTKTVFFAMLDTHEALSVEFSLAHGIYEARNTKARVLRVLSRSLLQKRVPQHQLNLTSSLALSSQYGERTGDGSGQLRSATAQRLSHDDVHCSYFIGRKT
jgi:hypothetical protein